MKTLEALINLVKRNARGREALHLQDASVCVSKKHE